MKQVILVHGSPEPGEVATQESITPGWFRWVQEQLPNVVIPPFPLDAEVVYADWVSVFEKVPVSEDTILIGHSCGGGFLLRYLSEHQEVRPARTLLVAAWLDPGHELSTSFMTFEIDPTLSDRTDLHVFISSDDSGSILESFELIREKFPNARYHEFADRGHFCGKRNFPELLELVS